MTFHDSLSATLGGLLEWPSATLMRGLWKPYLVIQNERFQFHPKIYEPEIIMQGPVRILWDLTIHQFQSRHCLQTVLFASHEGSQQENGLTQIAAIRVRPVRTWIPPNRWVFWSFCEFWWSPHFLGTTKMLVTVSFTCYMTWLWCHNPRNLRENRWILMAQRWHI